LDLPSTPEIVQACNDLTEAYSKCLSANAHRMWQMDNGEIAKGILRFVYKDFRRTLADKITFIITQLTLFNLKKRSVEQGSIKGLTDCITDLEKISSLLGAARQLGIEKRGAKSTLQIVVATLAALASLATVAVNLIPDQGFSTLLGQSFVPSNFANIVLAATALYFIYLGVFFVVRFYDKKSWLRDIVDEFEVDRIESELLHMLAPPNTTAESKP